VQEVGVFQVTDAQTAAPDLVFVGRANPAARCTDALFSELFFFALFIPFSKPLGVWIGWACGMTTAILIGFSGQIFGVDPITKLPPVSFQWIGPTSLSVNIVVGLVVSLVIPSGHSRRTKDGK
jgi:hypothetical protein